MLPESQVAKLRSTYLLSCKFHKHMSNRTHQTRYVRGYAFLLRPQPLFRGVPIQCRQYSNGHKCERSVIDRAWSIRRGSTDSTSVRVKSEHAPEWDYFTIYWRAPRSGSRLNRSLGTLRACPAFTGEVLVLRRSEDGHQFLDIRMVDRTNADAAVVQ